MASKKSFAAWSEEKQTRENKTVNGKTFAQFTQEKRREAAAKDYNMTVVPRSADYLDLTNNISRIARDMPVEQRKQEMALESAAEKYGATLYPRSADYLGTTNKLMQLAQETANPVKNESAPRMRSGFISAFTPTSDMYLNPYTADIARTMQEQADKEYAGYVADKTAYKENNAALNAQRKKTDNAYFRAALATPTAAASGAPSSVWDEYQERLAKAEAENEKLKAMGGRATGEILPGAIEQAGAGYVNAAGTALDFAARYGYFSNEDDWMNKTPEMGVVTKLHQTADDLQQSASERIAGVRTGRSALGQTLTDAAVSGVQMTGDALINAIAPGAGLAAMGVRAFGNAAADARAKGADVARQFGYGAAVAGVEVLSEKMFDGLASIYGKGMTDEIVEKVIKKLANSEGGQKVLKWLSSGIGEAAEEWAAGLIDPALESIIDNAGIFAHYDENTIADILHDGFVGFLLGSLGGAVEAVNYQPGQAQAAATAAREAEAAPQINNAIQNAYDIMANKGMFSPESRAAADAAKQGTQRAQEMAQSEYGSYQTALPTDAQYTAYKALTTPMSKMEVLDMAIDENGKLGENGAKYARELYRVAQTDDVSTTDWFAGFNSAYQAGRNGVEIEQNRFTDKLSPQVRKAAYNAGQEDAILAAPEQAPRFTFDIRQTEDGKYAVDVTDTQTGKTSSGGVFDTMETAEKVVEDFKAQTGGIVNEQSGSESEQRDAGVPGREERGGLRGRAEEIEQRQEAGKLRAESVRNSVVAAEGSEKVSSREAGISGGTDTASMHIVRQYEDDDMRAIRQDAKKRGVNVVFFTGEIEAKKGKKIIKARGEYSTDGKTLYVALDDPDFTARQIYDHEEFHARAHTDAELQQVCEDIINSHSAAELEEMVRAYVNAYGWTDMTNEEIMQEILADAYAGIDIFNYLSGFEGATMFTEAVRGAVKAREGEQQTERGPPAEDLYSLKLVNPVKPSSTAWTRGATYDEVKAAHPTLYELSSEEQDTRNPTQITSTVKTYRKIYDALRNEGFDGTILDASSGLGVGTQAGREEYGFKVDDIEPFPDKSYTPKYTDYSRLNKQYDVVISNAVLNVLPQDLRDAMVVKIGELLAPGGRAYINVRGDDVKNAKSKIAIDEDRMEYFIADGASYQKGFKKAELKAYLEDVLGDGYTVDAKGGFGGVSVVVRKNGGAQFSQKLTPQQDADYSAAVERGDMETAQRMVDEAAKAAGYDTPKLYHGTRAFGFTEFDPAKSDDRISLFATDNKRTAETYSGETERTRISDRNRIDVDSLSGEQLLSEAKKHLKRYQDYRLMTEKERADIRKDARHDIIMAKNDAQEFIDDHDGAFDSTKYAIANRLTTSLTMLASASDENAIEKAWNDWQEAVWDFKDIDDSLCGEFLDAIGSKQLYFAKNHLEDVMYSGDMYMTGDDYSYSYIYDNQLALELDASLHQGIYALYGKAGNQLVIDANGSNWNQIKAPEYLNLVGPQRTRDIAAAARAIGYDSILFKDLRDNGGETAYNGTSNIYIFFDANRMKSADPVTYDDNGNVIPLSERFNPENEDIRYSQKLTAEDELRRQNDELRERVEYWKGQTKRTTVPTARAEDAAKMGRQVVKDYDSEADAKEIGAALKDLTDYIMRGENITYAEVKDRAVEIARELVENAKTLREGDGETFREVRDALQKPLIISAQDAHDVTPDGWGKYRDSIRGKVNVSINGKGTPVDVAYAELSDRFPSLFPAEITHPADQLQQMVDVVSELAPVYENPFSYNMAEAIEYAANDIIDRVLGEDIRQTPPTFADKAAARLDAEKARGAEKLAQERERSKQKIADIKSRNAWATAQRIAEVRKQRDAKIVAIKEHYAEAKKTASERKADSAMRTRLLKIAKRLQNKKLPAVSRALLEQYIGNLDTVAKSITGNTVMDLSRLRSWYDDQKANNPDFIADAATEAKIARLSKTQISDMTPTQVAELTEVLLNFENEINTQRRMIDSEDKRDTRQMVLESLYNVEETKGSKKTAADWLVTNTLSPERLIKRLTGYAETDPLLMRTRELADGQRKMFDYQRRAEARFSRWANDKKLMDRLRSKERVKITGYSHGRAVEVEITPDMRMALYLHSLNDENMKHIANGGITIPDIDIYLKGDIGEAYSRGKTVKLSPSNIRSIVASMSAEERAYAQAAHDYFNGMSKDEINDVSEKLVGYSIAGVDDYFPIETDKNFTKSDIAELKRDGTIEGMGFLKERQHASNAIYLVPLTDVLNKSIQNHAKYVGMAIPVRNFSKIWGMNAHNDAAGEDNGLRQAIGQKWGERGIQAVERIISDVQNPSRSEDGKLLAKIRSNYAAAVLTLNASVALKQAASYPTAAAVLGWEPLIKAMGNVGKVNLDLINKYTPLQWYRSKGYSTQELGDIRSKGGVMDKVLSASIKTKDGREIPLLNWIQGIDLATTRKLWKASEYYVQQHNADLQRGSDAYYKAVADIYNKTIEQTQPNYTTMQRPQILRSSNQLLQSLVMFKTQPFQNFNILYDAVGELRAAERAAKNGDSSRLTQAKKNAVNAVSSNLVSAVVFAAMTMAWAYARRKKDKYEDKEGNFNPWKQLGKDVLSSEFGMIPFGSDAYNLLSSWVFGEKYYGMSNITADSISGALDATKKAVDTLSKTVSALLDGDETTTAYPETVAKELFDCAKDLSKIAGIPLENVVNLVTAVYTNVAASVNGEYVTGYEILRNTKNMDSSYNKSAAYDILYKAKQQDSEQYNELRKMMIEDGFKEKNIDSAMTKRAEKK